MASFTFSKTVTDWELLMAAVNANEADLTHLEPVWTELEAVLNTAKELGLQQDLLQSQAQQNSRLTDETVRTGKSLAARLRAGIRAKYGYKSEKLTEFQIRPMGRRLKAKAPEPPPVVPEAPAPVPTATA